MGLEGGGGPIEGADKAEETDGMFGGFAFGDFICGGSFAGYFSPVGEVLAVSLIAEEDDVRFTPCQMRDPYFAGRVKIAAGKAVGIITVSANPPVKSPAEPASSQFAGAGKGMERGEIHRRMKVEG